MTSLLPARLGTSGFLPLTYSPPTPPPPRPPAQLANDVGLKHYSWMKLYKARPIK